MDLAEPENGYLPQPAGSRPRSVTVGRTTYHYGTTPTENRMVLFKKLASKLSLSLAETAKRVSKMNFEERIEMIKLIHFSKNELYNENVTWLVNQAEEEFQGESKTGALRRISYGHHSPVKSPLKRRRASNLFPNKRSKGIGNDDESEFSDDDDMLKQMFERKTENLISTNSSYGAHNLPTTHTNESRCKMLVDKPVVASMSAESGTSSSVLVTPSTSSTDSVGANTTSGGSNFHFSDRKYTILPAPPGQYYKSSPPTVKSALPSEKDELDLIFDDSQAFSKAFDDVDWPTNSRKESLNKSGTSVQLKSDQKLHCTVDVGSIVKETKDSSFDTSSDSLLDQIFPSP